MNPLLKGLASIAQRTASDFIERGGRIIVGDEELTPEDVASTLGGLGPLLWMTVEFANDYGLKFPFATYEEATNALAGYRVREVVLGDLSASMALYTFSDFMRKELMSEQAVVIELDLTTLFANFNEWCRTHLSTHPAKPNPGSSPD